MSSAKPQSTPGAAAADAPPSAATADPGAGGAGGPLHLLVENAPLGIYQAAPDGRLLLANPALARMLGFDCAEALLADRPTLGAGLSVDPGRRAEVLAQAERDGGVLGVVSEMRRRDGGTLWVAEHLWAVRDAGSRLCRFEGVVEDATSRREAELTLRESEQRYALAVEGARDGLWEWHLPSGRVYYSPRWKEMLGLAGHALPEDLGSWLDRIHPDDHPRVKRDLEAHVAGHSAHFERELRMRHRDGSWIWVLARGLVARNAAGEPERMAGFTTDVTKRKLAEERLFHDAFHDALTGLANRALFGDRLGRALWRSRRREDYRFAVVFLDVDRVKLVNDSLGHGAGDALLVAVARRIEESLRAGDSAARVGGDEFAILIDDLPDPADAIRVVTRIQEALQMPVLLEGQEIFPTASIGIAFLREGYERAEEMMRDADTAAYAAKASGGARYQIFDKAMHERAVARLQTETELRRAIDRQELRAHYQPLVSLVTGRVVGFEALVRWQHPARGLVMPGEFIPIAEETGLIHRLGRWILREACAQVARWSRELGLETRLSVHVNLSGLQLADPEVVTQVLRVLDETALEPAQLQLEVTESAVLGDMQAAAQKLAQLHSLGVGICLDDFGTGYSSLSHLHQLPLTSIKIDRSFVRAMGDGSRETEICHAIVSLAHSLGLGVVAEGIEQEDQRRRLQALRCEVGQGYYFSRPVPPEEAVKLVTDGRIW